MRIPGRTDGTSAASAAGLLFALGPQAVAPLGVMQLDTLGLVLSIVLLVICLGIHEAAHGWVAWKCGDSTAKDLGRITLNPIPHIDPVMTIFLPTMLYLVSGGSYLFGGAKPVPVDFHRLRHPWRDMSLVALAGPASNLLLAVFFAFVWKALVTYGFYNGAAATEIARRSDRLPMIMETAVYFNVLLTVFNMVPIPPLDGSRVMAWLLPVSLRRPYVSLERFGLIIIFGLIMFVPGFQAFLRSSMDAVMDVLNHTISLGGLW